MLSACGRDTDARAALAGHARLLPPPGSPDRYCFALRAMQGMDCTAAGHDQVCPAWLHPGFAALAASGDDGLPWHRRRATWWQLLLTGPSGPR